MCLKTLNRPDKALAAIPHRKILLLLKATIKYFFFFEIYYFS